MLCSSWTLPPAMSLPARARPVRRHAHGRASRGKAAVAVAAAAMLCGVMGVAPGARAQTPDGAWPAASASPVFPPQGISRLSPAQSYPVHPPAHRIRSRELPPPVDPEPESGGDGWIPEPVTEGQVFGPLYDWSYQAAWDIEHQPVDVVSSAERTARRFSPIAGLSGLHYAQHGLVYREAGGPALSVGAIQPYTPRWGSAARLGGIQLSRWAGAPDSVLPEGEVGYSSTLGLLDYSDASAASGDLVYGPSAGGGSLRYGLTPSFTLESQLQKAPDMTAMGLGGMYALGEFGTVQAGAVQGRMNQFSGWRYQFGYNVALSDYLKLGYQGVVTDAGYGDLATYADGPLDASSQRNIVTAGLPLGSYGTFSGTYSGLRADGVMTEERLGVQHSLDLTPRTRFMLGANRDAVSGAYQMLMQLSVPVDVLEGGLLR